MARTTDRSRVLVVEDDDSLRAAVGDLLGRHGFDVALSGDAGEAELALAASPIDLIVLDVMLPGEDGLSLCRRLSAHGPPILMVSALGDAPDRIVGLELGAADYLAKPFEPRELVARIRAILRRERGSGTPRSPSGADTIATFAGLTYDFSAARLSDDQGRSVGLTSGDLRLLEAFLERPGRLLSRDRLLDLTHADPMGPFDRAIDLAVSRLRRKLATLTVTPCIETVRREGYRFVARVE